VQAVAPHNGAIQLLLDQQTSPQDVLQQLVSQHSAIEQFEIALPSLDEIFIRVVSEQ
jgi:ABC-2 type transport system ATP-binding protein